MTPLLRRPKCASTDRDWTKLQTIYFNEKNEPIVIYITDYNKMRIEKSKDEMKKVDAVLRN